MVSGLAVALTVRGPLTLTNTSSVPAQPIASVTVSVKFVEVVRFTVVGFWTLELTR